MSFRNEFDGHTLAPALEQAKRLTGVVFKTASVDKGYPGLKVHGETVIVRPDNGKQKKSRYETEK